MKILKAVVDGKVIYFYSTSVINLDQAIIPFSMIYKLILSISSKLMMIIIVTLSNKDFFCTCLFTLNVDISHNRVTQSCVTELD